MGDFSPLLWSVCIEYIPKDIKDLKEMMSKTKYDFQHVAFFNTHLGWFQVFQLFHRESWPSVDYTSYAYVTCLFDNILHPRSASLVVWTMFSITFGMVRMMMMMMMVMMMMMTTMMIPNDNTSMQFCKWLKAPVENYRGIRLFVWVVCIAMVMISFSHLIQSTSGWLWVYPRDIPYELHQVLQFR